MIHAYACQSRQRTESSGFQIHTIQSRFEPLSHHYCSYVLPLTYCSDCHSNELNESYSYGPEIFFTYYSSEKGTMWTWTRSLYFISYEQRVTARPTVDTQTLIYERIVIPFFIVNTKKNVGPLGIRTHPENSHVCALPHTQYFFLRGWDYLQYDYLLLLKTVE